MSTRQCSFRSHPLAGGEEGQRQDAEGEQARAQFGEVAVAAVTSLLGLRRVRPSPAWRARRCTTLTQLPVAFCGRIRANSLAVAGLMLTISPYQTWPG
jgi:hypothetical protein